MHTRIYGPHGSSNRACMRAYMAIYGGIHGACMRAYMAIYGSIHRPHGSSNGACMGAYMGHIWGHIWAIWEQQWGMHARIYGHIWGYTWVTWEQQWGMYARIYGHIWEQPYRESREEGNNRESLPFPSNPCPFLSAPFPTGREGSGGYSLPFPSLFRSVEVVIGARRLYE